MALLDNAVTASADVLAKHQQDSWPAQAAHVAENSDFYRGLWGGKAPPHDLRDLPELPLSDKAMLRMSQADHPPFGNYLAARKDQAARLHRTSGTTGQAMNLAMSARDCELTEIVGGRCQSAAGLGPGHVVVHCLNYQMWMGGLTDHMTLERTGALVVPFGVGNTELLVRTIQEVGITAISCTPSARQGSSVRGTSRRRAGASTDACSALPTSTARHARPVRAWAFASVAPLVKTTSPGLAWTKAATCSRAVSTTARAARPSA